MLAMACIAGGDVLKRFVPGDAHEGVVAAIVEFVLGAQLGFVGKRGEAIVGPLLPARPQHGSFQP